MRSLKLAGLVFGLVAAAVMSSAGVRAQDNTEKCTFDTVDQVKIQGTYYPSAKLKKSPVVLLLHKFGGSSSQDGWNDLALELQKADFAVLSFDFRGHGNSTGVQPGFWMDKDNQTLVSGFSPTKPKQNISYKDFHASYMPLLVNDIAAAKVYLDKRNDSGDCNSANLILIGAEEGATLGAMWMYSEMFRKKVTSINALGVITGVDPTLEGSRIGAALWLTISPKLGSQSVPLKLWTKTAGADQNVPMAFIYGAKNTADANVGKLLLEVAKDQGEKNKWTGDKAIADTDLRGHALLSAKLPTREWIVKDYLKKLMAEKAMPAWQERKVTENPFVWDFPRVATPLAKMPNEDSFRKLPVNLLVSPP